MGQQQRHGLTSPQTVLIRTRHGAATPGGRGFPPASTFPAPPLLPRDTGNGQERAERDKTEEKNGPAPSRGRVQTPLAQAPPQPSDKAPRASGPRPLCEPPRGSAPPQLLHPCRGGQGHRGSPTLRLDLRRCQAGEGATNSPRQAALRGSRHGGENLLAQLGKAGHSSLPQAHTTIPRARDDAQGGWQSLTSLGQGTASSW